jgi:hypothetical protein
VNTESPEQKAHSLKTWNCGDWEEVWGKEHCVSRNYVVKGVPSMSTFCLLHTARSVHQQIREEDEKAQEPGRAEQEFTGLALW